MLTEEEYMNLYYESEFSAFDFLSLFIAINVLDNNYSFDRNNLIEFIRLCKNDSKYIRLLRDIHIGYNGIFYYSDDLGEAIVKLKWGKILYTVSPEESSAICIFENVSVLELVDNREEFIDEMHLFIQEFREFEMNKGKSNIHLGLKR